MLVVEIFFGLFQIGRRDHIEGISGKVYLKVEASFPDELKMLGKPVEGYMDVGSDHFFVSADALVSALGSFFVSFFAEVSGLSFLSAPSFASFLSFPA